MLKQEYKEDETNLNDALKLAIKVLSKTLDTTKLTSERVISSFFSDYQLFICLMTTIFSC